MLDINSKRIYIEQTPVNEKDYTEDGESSEDEHSIRSKNGNIDVLILKVISNFIAFIMTIKFCARFICFLVET